MKNIELYIVKAGDTLYNIAKKYQIVWQDLMKINGMDNLMNLTNNCHILESTFSFDSIDAYYYIFYLCRRNRPKLSFLTCCL